MAGQNNQAVVAALEVTLQPQSPQHLKQATDQLKAMESTPGFGMMMLELTTMQQLSEGIRLSSAIYFKNYIMREWVPDAKDIISPADRNGIKQNLVNVMVSSPAKIQNQLTHALSIISAADFPGNFETLLPSLVQHSAKDDFGVLNGVLGTAHNMFYRYRTEGKSDALWKEIKYVGDHFPAPLLGLWNRMLAQIEPNAQNKNVLKEVVKVLEQILQVLRSLISQDLLQHVEDNLGAWLNPAKMLLQYTNPLLNPADEDEPGVLDKLQSEICEVATLFTMKYEEEFGQYNGPFVDTIWNMLTKLSAQERYDPLCTAAIRFLTSVVRRPWSKDMFSNVEHLKMICEKVVVPQLRLRESDVHMFHGNAEEFVRRDMEGSDAQTRRRTTVDFVRGLCKHFNQQVSEILKQYVGVMLNQYGQDPKNNWVHKDAAIYIILALTIQGETRAAGVTQVNEFINIMDFFKTQVLPELQAPNADELPVLKASCLKFVAKFRAQLPVQFYGELLPLLVKFLRSEEYVLHTYAASSIEKLLGMKDNGVPRVKEADMTKELAEALLMSLFGALKDDSEENEYVMRAIMRVAAVGKGAMAPVAQAIIEQLTKILERVCKNPRNPKFNHYLFETLSCLVTNLGTSEQMVAAFENSLFPVFSQMLQMETAQEFGPYVFQIMAQLLGLRKAVTDKYQGLYPSLLHPAVWALDGNVPALVQLLLRYLMTPGGVQEVCKDNRLQGLLGIFKQKLNPTKKHELEAMRLLALIYTFVPRETIKPLQQHILPLIFDRLQNKKTPRYCGALVACLSRFVLKHGVAALIQDFEGFQPGILGMVMRSVWCPNIQRVPDTLERKVVAAAMTRLLTAPEVLTGGMQEMWPELLTALVKLFELPSKAQDDEDLLEVSQKGFKTAYRRLAYARLQGYDPCADVKDPKALLAQALGRLSQTAPGQLPSLIQRAGEKVTMAVQSYLQQAGVTLQ